MFAAIIWRKSEAGQPARWLLGILLLMAYKLMEGAISHGAAVPLFSTQSNVWTVGWWASFWPHLLGWAPLAVLWLGPLFLAYTQRLAREQRWSWRLAFWHFTPAVLVFCLQLPQQLLSAESKLQLWQSQASGAGMTGPIIILLVVVKVHLGSYLWAGWLRLKSLARAAPHEHSDQRGVHLQWQHRLCFLLMALEALWVLLFVLQQSVGLSTLNHVGDLWLLAMAVIILLLAFWGLSHPDTVLDVRARSADEACAHRSLPSVVRNAVDTDTIVAELTPSGPRSEPNNKYSGSPVDADNAPELLDHLRQVLAEQQLYRQSQLRLGDLAQACGLRTHIVSQLINQYLAMNFYQFINAQRVEYAQQLMQAEGAEMSLERIAVESGFSNRVTFNKAFKSQYQMSPSAYRKQLNAAMAAEMAN